MICQRSGRCCVTSIVVIGVVENGEPRLKVKPAMRACPNLVVTPDDGKASCAVHEEPWYKFTACFAHGNPDVDPDHAVFPSKPCMIGLVSRENKLNVFRDEEPGGGLLEDLGPLKYDEDGIQVDDDAY